jgi:hypothetical protein
VFAITGVEKVGEYSNADRPNGGHEYAPKSEALGTLETDDRGDGQYSLVVPGLGADAGEISTSSADCVVGGISPYDLTRLRWPCSC